MSEPYELGIEQRLAQMVEELVVSRQETRVSRAETAASRAETAVSREETVLSRAETSAALVQVGNLETALKTSRVIGMAMRILMVRRNLTEAAAFEALTQASQHRNRKLRDIADEVVHTGDLEDLQRRGRRPPA
ncbi:ANTAR domain-containing protein [Modestobacter sp. SSW1-42]|uniref:ANTAR domain-containing protein n=1 Tax=Modestobacter sp. SSW1-42 TaxID=596372 RepID=UPI00398645D9